MGTGMGASASLTSSTPTLTWSRSKGILWIVVDPLKSFPRATRWGGFSLTYNPKGSTQLYFVLTQVFERPTSNSGGSASLCDCIYDWNWDCIWLKDNISCQVTFFVIDSSSWSLIFCVSFSRSLEAMEEDVREVLEAGPKYFLIITPGLAPRTRLGCSSRPMAAVNTSWHPWVTKKSCEAYSSKESCEEHIYWFTQSQ